MLRDCSHHKYRETIACVCPFTGNFILSDIRCIFLRNSSGDKKNRQSPSIHDV